MQPADILNPPAPLQPGQCYEWHQLNGASVGLALAQLMMHQTKPMLIIAPDNLAISRLLAEYYFFSHLKTGLTEFPDWETLPYDHFSPHQDIISDRLAVLAQMDLWQKGAVITTISTLMHYLPPKDYLSSQSFIVKVGETLNLDILKTRLVKSGYYAVSQVREHGEFAVRGSIIDIFPMGSEQPFRLDLLDNEIDSIRLFSVETQRSLEKISNIHLLPAKEFPLTEEAIEHFRHAFREQFNGNPLKCPIYQDISQGIASTGVEYYLPLFFKHTTTLLDYLPADALLITLEDIEGKAQEFWQEVLRRYEQGRHNLERPLLPPERLFISPTKIISTLKNYARLQINAGCKATKKQYVFNFPTRKLPPLAVNYKEAQPLLAVQQFIENHPGRLIFSAESLGRREALLQMFNSIAFKPLFFHSWHEFLNSSATHGIVVAPLEESFQLDEPPITVITESELYGKRIMQRRLRKKSTQDPENLIRDLTELKLHDPIVHLHHGVGRYRGLETLTVGDQTGEFLCLEYQGGDKLYVPVASLHLVSRYSGADPEVTPINKLGTEQWSRAKRKALEKVRDVAAELLELYAKRAAQPGEGYQPVTEQYHAFAAAFPFEETPDQLQAIENVLNDMLAPRPMDRVICGEVGFGKTEVAMRAAFLAVMNGKQVVVLVPTTLLAQQHFQNFQDRFADWPVKVAILSRFKTKKDQQNTLNHTAEGKVDILIGTHKLLQAGIQFKSLGLVIIDEEHRFGVKQKETLKALRTDVNMLTLTATPIPRTLNMALAGIRDLSIIATPPARRLSVKTFVHAYDTQIIQEAIQREILRGGQVYFLHNDVASIDRIAAEINQLIPEARTTIAHGQMHERELERTMSDFYHRRHNVLICSTIIESGIDIPTANTIIINRADKFGIAQLHQLRGRVGRSHHQAYAYLLIPAEQAISNDARKRLDAISTFDDLGIGFTLATHDLEIRGAGELLGEQQSGDMQEIGFTLYMDLLSRSVDALKAGQAMPDESTMLYQGSEIDLHITALIPEDYLNDIALRLQFYKRIANAKNMSELDDIQIEMIDRFGLLPEPLKNLIAITLLKQKANRYGIIKLEANEKGGKFEFNEHPHVDPAIIIKLIQTLPQRFRLENGTKLKFTLAPHAKKDRIQLVDQALDQLGPVASY